LRAFAEQGKVDSDLLETYDSKLTEAGEYIHKVRKEILIHFLPKFNQHYDFLVQEAKENVEIQYKSDLLGADFISLLRKNRQRDLVLQRTTSGIHRDDFLFTLNEQELKRAGSQGQQKSFLISLKLAEFQTIAEKKNLKPILLLDDIFDKLDDFRIHQLMKLVSKGRFGQMFITDARQGRSEQILKDAGVSAQLFVLENSTFKQEWLKI
jgi:DNA replication and repair protein RecF